LLCGQLVVKLKRRTFQVNQFSLAINVPTDDLSVLQRGLEKILSTHAPHFNEFRLLGVRASELRSVTELALQPTLSQLFTMAKKRAEGSQRKNEVIVIASDDEVSCDLKEEDVGDDDVLVLSPPPQPCKRPR
jgi:hypothetical protein